MSVPITSNLTHKQWKDKNDKHKKRARRKGLAHSATLTDYKEILDSHQGRCHYCGSESILTLDHVVPVSKGGGHVRGNIVFACYRCNQDKDSMPADDFLFNRNFGSLRYVLVS